MTPLEAAGSLNRTKESDSPRGGCDSENFERLLRANCHHGSPRRRQPEAGYIVRSPILFPSTCTLSQFQVSCISSISTAGSFRGCRSASGRDRRELRRSISCAMRQNRPGDAPMLGSQRNGGEIHVPALFEPPPHPLAFGIGLLVHQAQIRSGAIHRQRAQTPVALASNLPRCRVLQRRQLHCIPELGGI